MIEFAERWIFVAVWALFLPLLGYSFFVLFTLVAALGFLLGIKTLVLVIYLMGFVPTFATAAVYEFLFRRLRLSIAFVAVCPIGIVATWGWWTFLGIEQIGRNYFTFALFASTSLALFVMMVVGKAWDTRFSRR